MAQSRGGHREFPDPHLRGEKNPRDRGKTCLEKPHDTCHGHRFYHGRWNVHAVPEKNDIELTVFPVFSSSVEGSQRCQGGMEVFRKLLVWLRSRPHPAIQLRELLKGCGVSAAAKVLPHRTPQRFAWSRSLPSASAGPGAPQYPDPSARHS